MAEVNSMADSLVETFMARREVNLGTCKRQVGDFIHEYTDESQIDPRARDRLVRMGYIERRTVPQSELDAWQARWDEQNAPKGDTEGSGAEEGESSEEETSETEVEEATVIPAVEETIEDLGPTEAEETETPSATKKKVVRAPRSNRRRS